MVRRLSIRLLERLYDKIKENNEKINQKIEEHKKRSIELNQNPDDNLIKKYLNTPGLSIWLAENCGGYKRGRKIDKKDISNIKQLGYENVWVSDIEVKGLNERIDKKSELLFLKEQLIEKLADIFIPINEKDAGTKKKASKINLLEGSDLLSLRIDPLQKEGARIISEKIFGEMGLKLKPITDIIDKIYSLGIKTISLKDNRTLGNFFITSDDSGNSKYNIKKYQVSNYLIMHSINVGIMFTLTLQNIQKERIEHGTQLSSARYISGQKFKKEYRVTYTQDVVKSACLGSFIFDFGFNHSVLKQILDKETKVLINESGEAIYKGFTFIDEKEYEILKRHVNVGSHIIQNLGIDESSIITNMIRTHHCYLNGEGYPKRKGQEYEIVINQNKDNKKTIKVFRYDTPIYEITNLLSIIDTYDAMINRRPWRLPFTRYDAVEYLFNNSCYLINPETGEIDKKGIYSFSGYEKRKKRFDRYLVDKFFETIQPYNIGEILPLKDIETNKKIAEAIVINYTSTPNRPIIRIILNQKPLEINLEEAKNHRFFLGEYIVTTKKDKDQK